MPVLNAKLTVNVPDTGGCMNPAYRTLYVDAGRVIAVEYFEPVAVALPVLESAAE